MKKCTFVLSLFAAVLVFGAADLVLPDDWGVPVEGQKTNMSLVAKVLDWEDSYVTAAGSVLGVFDADGMCLGCGELVAIPNNDLAFSVVIAAPGSTETVLTLKILNSEEGEVHDIQETLNYEVDGIAGTPSAPLDLHYAPRQIEQELTLNQNWNWISFNVYQGERTLDEFLADYTQYATDGDTILAEEGIGHAYFTTDGNTWIASDTSFKLEPGRMYKLFKQSADSCTIKVGGVVADPSMPIAVHAGWNWLGYIGEFPATIEAIYMEGGFANDDMIKQQTANQVFFSDDNWYGGTVEFHPGMGYKLKVSVDGTVDFRNAAAHIIE